MPSRAPSKPPAIPNKGQVLAWGMYDLANQSFTLLVTTLFLPIYFTTRVAQSPEQGRFLWGLAFAIPSAVVVVLSPILGAAADGTGRKKELLTILAVSCAALTAALGLVTPGAGGVALAMTLYMLANVLFMCGENILAAFLPELSTPANIGRVSAIGWTMGYLGAMLCLPAALGVMLLFEDDPARPGQKPDAAFRWILCFAGAWFLVCAVPTMLVLREKAPDVRLPARDLIPTAFGRLRDSARQAQRYSNVAKFLVAFFIYSCGVQVFIAFSGVLAERHLKTPQELILFIWALSAIAGLTSFGTGFLQDRIGHVRTIIAALVVWLLTALGAALMPRTVDPGSGKALVWAVGVGVGVGLGMIGSAGRALMGAMTPQTRTAEFFGLWGMAFKAAGAVGVLGYSTLTALAGEKWAMLAVACAFICGICGLLYVDVEKGRQAAGNESRG